jgi:antitoxin component YwqK of YwqJK toxin-antitoxin module
MKKSQLKITILLFLVSLVAANAQEKINQLDVKGKKDGLWKGIHEKSNRPRYEGTFQNGVEAGTFKYYDDTKAQSLLATRIFSQNGTVAQTTFFDQKANKVSEGRTVNRMNEGVWNYYHKASTQLMTVENYKDGKLEGNRKVYFLSGAVAEEATYKNGQRDGAYKVYLENGIVAEEINFKNGLYNGSAEFRDGTGKIVSKGNFVKDEKKGIWEFYEAGKLVKKEKYPLRVKFKKRTDIPKQ